MAQDHDSDGASDNSVSRRKLLKGAALSIGGAALLVAAASPAQAKMAQANAGYQDKPGKDGSTCSSCALFKAPDACTLVDGKISPNGWCRFYAKKTS